MESRTVDAAKRAARSGRAVSNNDDAALEQCLLLSLGHPVEITSAQWDSVFDCAVAERCAALAWLRSESRIRTAAPPAVFARWDAWVSAHIARVELQLALLAQVSQWLDAHGIPTVVLKGIPFGAGLYGSWWARTVNDIDLYLAHEQCAAAADVLRASGWRHLRGAAPADMEFVKQVDGTLMMLELHGTLGGPWLGGLLFPIPDHSETTIRGHRLRAHTGSFLPAYLASHLLQHSERPLLWLVDFKTFWTGMLEDERVSARLAARAAALGRVLAIVEQWVELLGAIERTRDSSALTALRREVLRPSPTVAFVQLLRTAEGVQAAGGILIQLLWPRELRTDPIQVLRIWGRRILRRLRPALSLSGRGS